MGNVNNGNRDRDRDRDRDREKERDYRKSYNFQTTNLNENPIESSDLSARNRDHSSREHLKTLDDSSLIANTRFSVTKVASMESKEKLPHVDPVTSQSVADGQDSFCRPRSNTVSGDSQYSQNRNLPTVFRWRGGGKQVCIGGDFSEWKTVPMAKSHGDFVTIIDLPEGEHAYKFYVDGKWKHDPETKIVEDKSGSKSNIVNVKECDYEVFQALEKDIEEEQDIETMNLKKDYFQVIPSKKPWEKPTAPPALPPHSLQIILNKDTPLSCDPTLLPEPNHVMLNHLFDLSIKESVMVLSTSQRYRKKCVTTLLYKQI